MGTKSLDRCERELSWYAKEYSLMMIEGRKAEEELLDSAFRGIEQMLNEELRKWKNPFFRLWMRFTDTVEQIYTYWRRRVGKEKG